MIRTLEKQQSVLNFMSLRLISSMLFAYQFYEKLVNLCMRYKRGRGETVLSYIILYYNIYVYFLYQAQKEYLSSNFVSAYVDNLRKHWQFPCHLASELLWNNACKTSVSCCHFKSRIYYLSLRRTYRSYWSRNELVLSFLNSLRRKRVHSNNIYISVHSQKRTRAIEMLARVVFFLVCRQSCPKRKVSFFNLFL